MLVTTATYGVTKSHLLVLSLPNLNESSYLYIGEPPIYMWELLFTCGSGGTKFWGGKSQGFMTSVSIPGGSYLHIGALIYYKQELHM